MSQFNYCFPISIFHSRQLNNGFNKIHERALRLVHNYNNKLTLNDPLDLGNSVAIHHQKPSYTCKAIFNVKYSLAPDLK